MADQNWVDVMEMTCGCSNDNEIAYRMCTLVHDEVLLYVGLQMAGDCWQSGFLPATSCPC